MFKRLLYGLFFFLISALYLFFPGKVYADNQFGVDAVVTYKVQDSGDTLVTHDITLENLFSSLYATTYTLTLDNISAQKIDARDDAGRVIPTEITNSNQKLAIKLTFSDSVVGLGAKRHFKISYENSNFAVKTGEVWEISIPRLGDSGSFRNYLINLEVPDSFGQEAYVSPLPTTKNTDGGVKTYSFSKNIISETGVTAGFGQFQVFNYIQVVFNHKYGIPFLDKQLKNS